MKKKTLSPTYKKRMEKQKAALKALVLRNEAFNKMSKAEKRVAIAKDVLETVKNRKIVPEANSYITGINTIDRELDAQQAINKKNFPVCSVCAWGACVLSMAKLGNTLTVGDIQDIDTSYINRDNATIKKVRSIFTPRQVAMIEAAFEKNFHDDLPFSIAVNRNVSYNIKLYSDLLASSKFGRNGRNFGSDKERLIGIMENIILNKGTFKP